ncbi:MAG: cation diffusion facilitator family transporter [Candidatus Cloacimonadaceae bacterium]
MKDRDTTTNNTINLGLFCNIGLSVLKTFIGIFGHSTALLADGINSTSDVVYYVAVKILAKQANKPADAEHPYGHRQLESISAIVVGAFILTTGIAIFWETVNSIYDLLSGNNVARTISSAVLVVAIFTFCLKIVLYLITRGNAKQTKNPTLRALANDHLNDILASLSVVVGVVGSYFGLPWMDPLAGAIVSIFILRTGVSIIMDSSSELMDTFPDPSFKDDLKMSAEKVQGVKNANVIGMHRFGPYFTINIEIGIDGSLSIRQGHAIADEVEKKLMNDFSGSLRNVHVHYQPYDSSEDTS